MVAVAFAVYSSPGLARETLIVCLQTGASFMETTSPPSIISLAHFKEVICALDFCEFPDWRVALGGRLCISQ